MRDLSSMMFLQAMYGILATFGESVLLHFDKRTRFIVH